MYLEEFEESKEVLLCLPVRSAFGMTKDSSITFHLLKCNLGKALPFNAG